MKYKIIHLFVKLTNLFQSKIITTKVNKKIIFLFFIIAVIAMQLKTFTRFHWIIHDHVIHELYCQNSDTFGNMGNRRHLCFFLMERPYCDFTFGFYEFRMSFC
jgi:hypothetical protein